MKLGDPITIRDMNRHRAEIEWLGMAVLLVGDREDIWQVIEAKTVAGKLVLTIQCDEKVREVSRHELIRLTMEEAARRFYRISPRWERIRVILMAPQSAQVKMKERLRGTINAKQDSLGRRWKGKIVKNGTYTREQT